MCCQVISAEDEEQLFNDPALVIRRRRVGKEYKNQPIALNQEEMQTKTLETSGFSGLRFKIVDPL